MYIPERRTTFSGAGAPAGAPIIACSLFSRGTESTVWRVHCVNQKLLTTRRTIGAVAHGYFSRTTEDFSFPTTYVVKE